MLNAFIVVWRESLEAILVIGVLMAWISRQEDGAPLRRGLWWGVLAGVLLAIAVGGTTFLAQSQFAGHSLEVFQLLMVLLAAGLIFQMVLWMHKHGRHMKRELEARAERSSGVWGVAAIAALAVAREGAETVVFVYGLTFQDGALGVWGLLIAAAAGLALAMTTGWVVARFARFFNYRTVFRVSEILLLLIAGALLVNGIDRMIALEWLPTLMNTVWDTSRWIDDGHGPGRLLAEFLGYRARPSGILLLGLVAYWSLAIWRLKRADRPVVAA